MICYRGNKSPIHMSDRIIHRRARDVRLWAGAVFYCDVELDSTLLMIWTVEETMTVRNERY